jgi:Tfp pilus assembly protein PilF
MGTLPVTAVVEQAEATFGEGRYREALRLCQGLVRVFPTYLTAQRVLGRAALRAGELELAEEAYQTVRQLDPDDREAALALSQIAEQRGELETALAFAQAAWEGSPWDRELRERVGRLAEACHGRGQLFLTGAALGSQYSRGGYWTRAANEWRAVLERGVARPDVQQRFALALWRGGDLQAAARCCEALLQELPDAVVPLLILAAVAEEQGEPGEAAALLERARRVDLDGSRATTLVSEGVDAARLAVRPLPIPEIEETVLIAEPPASAAAMPVPEVAEVSPVLEPAEGLLQLPTDEELEAARPTAEAVAGYTGLLRSLEVAGLEPFSPVEGATEGEAELPDELVALASDEEVEAARPREVLEPGWTGLLKSYELEGIEPLASEEFGLPGEVGAEPDVGRVSRVIEGGEAGRPGSETAGDAASRVAPGIVPSEEGISWVEHAVLDWARDVGVGAVSGAIEAGEEAGEAWAPGAEREVLAAGAEAMHGGAPDAGWWGDEAQREELAAAAERLGVGADLFARSRAMKEDLVSTGLLGERVADGGVPGQGEVAPAEIERLLAAGRVEEALARCRMLYRAGRESDEALIRLLTPLADAGGPGAVEADRILGAIYRRQGAQALAARHYERSLRRA